MLYYKITPKQNLELAYFCEKWPLSENCNNGLPYLGEVGSTLWPMLSLDQPNSSLPTAILGDVWMAIL